jgi:hypothetical protein
MIDEAKILIMSVVNGHELEVKLPLVTPNDVQEFMKSIGYEKNNIDTNGWQWDYWIDYSNGGKVFTFSGSGYYGNQKFGVKEE